MHKVCLPSLTFLTESQALPTHPPTHSPENCLSVCGRDRNVTLHADKLTSLKLPQTSRRIATSPRDLPHPLPTPQCRCKPSVKYRASHVDYFRVQDGSYLEALEQIVAPPNDTLRKLYSAAPAVESTSSYLGLLSACGGLA